MQRAVQRERCCQGTDEASLTCGRGRGSTGAGPDREVQCEAQPQRCGPHPATVAAQQRKRGARRWGFERAGASWPELWLATYGMVFNSYIIVNQYCACFSGCQHAPLRLHEI